MAGEKAGVGAPSDGASEIGKSMMSLMEMANKGPGSQTSEAKDTPPQPQDNSESSSAGKTETESTYDIIAEKLKMQRRGVMTLNAINSIDLHNAVTEAVEQRVNQDVRGSKKLGAVTKIPIVGRVIKAGIASKRRSEAMQGVRESGNLESAFTSLNLDPTNSKAVNLRSEDSHSERTWNILQNGRKEQDGTIRSELDQDDKIERMTEQEGIVKEALNSYYAKLKEAKTDEDKKLAKSEFDKAISDAFGSKERQRSKTEEMLFGSHGGQEEILSMKGINSARDGIEALAEDSRITEEHLREYLDNNLSLYRTSFKEGVNTKKRVDNITAAVVAGGIAGSVAYAMFGYGARRKLAGLGLTGAFAGAAYGAVRGVQNAKNRLNEAEINNATTPTTSETAPSEAPETTRQSAANKTPGRAIGAFFGKIDALKRKGAGEKSYLDQIEKLRDRKSAKELDNNLTSELELAKEGDDKFDINKLKSSYAEIIARSRFSNKNNLNLIKYEGDDKAKLEASLFEARKQIFGDTLNNPDSPEYRQIQQSLDQLISARESEFQEASNKAKKLERNYIIRTAAIEMIYGAAMGAGAGAIFGAVRELAGDSLESLADGQDLSGENISPSSESIVDVTEAPDGSYTAEINGVKVDNIEYDDTGALTPESAERIQELTGAKVESVESYSDVLPEGQTKEITASEFFNGDSDNLPDNMEAMRINTPRSWNVTPEGYDRVSVQIPHFRGDNGDIVIRVEPMPGQDVDLDGTKLFFTAGGNAENVGIAVERAADGTYTIPGDSPIADLIDENGVFHGQAEVIRENGNTTEVFSTFGSNNLDPTTEVTVSNVDTPRPTIENHIITEAEDGTITEQTLATPVTEQKLFEYMASTGETPIRDTGSTVEFIDTGETAEMTTAGGESVDIHRFRHEGGYNASQDPYFDKDKWLDGNLNSGSSVVRELVGAEGEGHTAREIDEIFMNKVQTGEITESDVIEHYVENLSKSPEAIVTTRAMMGDLYADLGNGQQLIDTVEEINQLANTISLDPDAYDSFVNDTLNTFYDKIDGGSFRFIDYTQEQYQYTSWAKGGNDGDVIQCIGRKLHPSSDDGIGIAWLDSNGNSIYDHDTVRKMWNIPADQDLSYVSDRLNCMQKTAQGIGHTPETPAPAATTTVPQQTPTQVTPSTPTPAPVVPKAPIVPDEPESIPEPEPEPVPEPEPEPTPPEPEPEPTPPEPEPEPTPPEPEPEPTPPEPEPEPTPPEPEPEPTPPEPEPEPEPTPEPPRHTPKDTEAEIRNAGKYASPMELDEDVTPKTTLEEDQRNFDEIAKQQQEDAAKAAEAERVRADQAAAEEAAKAQAAKEQAAREAAEAEKQAQMAEAERQAAAAREAEARRQADEAANKAQAEAAAKQAAAAEAERAAAAERAAREAAQDSANSSSSATSAASSAQSGATATDRSSIYEAMTGGGGE